MVGTKRGFSLAEALVVMTVVSIFFAFAAKVVTTRQKPQVASNPHGYFECYLDGNTLMQARKNEQVLIAPQNANGTCTFQPPKGVAEFNITTTGIALYQATVPCANTDINIRIDNNSEDPSITILTANDEYRITSEDSDIDSELDERTLEESLRGTFRESYPDSQIYNNGNIRTGIMFAW